MINFEKIKKECPKSWQLLKKWTEGKLKEIKAKMMAGAPPDSEEIPFPEITDVLVESTLSWNMRSLLDFLDGNKIWLSFDADNNGCRYDVGEGGGWSEQYNNRVDCETASFEAAFVVLEGMYESI